MKSASARLDDILDIDIRRERSSSRACSSAAVKSRGTACQLDSHVDVDKRTHDSSVDLVVSYMDTRLCGRAYSDGKTTMSTSDHDGDNDQL